MITKLLSTAVRFYLRSQVSQVEDLQVQIKGKNRQILTGYIPEIFLSCSKGIYQGLYLRKIAVNGHNIAINLPEILKKKPLRLLEPIIIQVTLGLDAKDLLLSLESDLLQSGLTDLWQIILNSQPEIALEPQSINSAITWTDIAIINQELHISGTYQSSQGELNNLDLFTEVSLANSHTLCLFPLRIKHEPNKIQHLVEKLEIDLGNQINIEKLGIEAEQILCAGNITVEN